MKKFKNGEMYFLWCYEPSNGHDKIYGIFHKFSGENYTVSGKRNKNLRMDIKPVGNSVLSKLLDDKTLRKEEPYRETSDPGVVSQIEKHFKSLNLVEEQTKVKVVEWFGIQKVKSKVELEGFEKGVVYQVVGVVEGSDSSKQQVLKVENKFAEEVDVKNPDDIFEPMT